MVRYVTKDEIGEEVVKIVRDKHIRSWDSSWLPRLAFDNDTAEYACDNCGQDRDEIHFQYNIGCAAGTDEVVFDWNVDLERVYLQGYVCRNCGSAHIELYESSPENDGEVITERDGV